MDSSGSYQDHSAKLAGRLPSATAIDRRIAHARSASDLDTASAIVQIPLGMDLEEGRTFGNRVVSISSVSNSASK
jgi:hypothetical protein